MATKIISTIYLQKHLQIIWSMFVSYGTHATIILCLWGFLCVRDGGHGVNKICVHLLTVFSTLFVEWFLLCWISVRTGKHPYILLANLVMLMLWNVWYPILWLMSREETSMEKHLIRYMNNGKNASLCIIVTGQNYIQVKFYYLRLILHFLCLLALTDE